MSRPRAATLGGERRRDESRRRVSGERGVEGGKGRRHRKWRTAMHILCVTSATQTTGKIPGKEEQECGRGRSRSVEGG